MTDEMGSPWMEVEAEPKVYLQWGTAVEYSNYDTTNRTISDVAPHATAHICVDPRVTPLSKEADIWLPLRPGTDGALALGWFNWIIENEAYDDTMVRRWSNATSVSYTHLVVVGGPLGRGRQLSREAHGHGRAPNFQQLLSGFHHRLGARAAPLVLAALAIAVDEHHLALSLIHI